MVTTDEVEPALRRHVAAVAAGGAVLLALLALLGLEAKLRSEPFGAAHTLALLALFALVAASLAMLAMAIFDGLLLVAAFVGFAVL